jgi:hypothetical protein
MLAFTSVSFGVKNFSTSSRFFTCSILLKNLFVLAEDLEAPKASVLRQRGLGFYAKVAKPIWLWWDWTVRNSRVAFQNCHAGFSG